MFSINETFVFGQQARPWLANTAAPTLELIREDARTPEEIERDQRKEAEALTTPMFTGEALEEERDAPDEQELDHENDQPPPMTPTASEEITPLSCYLALVSLAHEQAVTLWIDTAYRGRFYAQLPQAILTAHHAGLTDAEISAALQIGEFQGKREREAAAHELDDVADTRSADPLPIPSESTIREAAAPQEGFRARLRREQRPLRNLYPHHYTQGAVPGFWMEREHIRNRLPYLAEGISRLDEDHLTSLAGSIGEALQASYWTILETALSHYLDPERETAPQRV